MKLSSQRVDLRAQNEGEVHTFDDGFWVRTRSTEYGPYRQAHQLAEQRAQRKAGKGAVPPFQMERVTYECMLDHLLLDWGGLEDDDGTEVPFDRARELILDPQYKPLATRCFSAAVFIGEQREEEKKEAAGNSAPRSAGG